MSSYKPFFSVVIPLYNKEAHIGKTIQSVLNQNYYDFELVVVDDGSTDNSVGIVQSFADQRIKVISKLNGGVSCARNYGVTHTHCDYIAFLDADDLWEPSYLKEMRRLIERFPNCGLYSSSYNIVEKNKVSNYCNIIPEGILDNYFKIELSNQITRISATIVHKSIFKEIGGFPIGMISGEDSYFCAKVAIRYPIVFTPKVLVSYNEKFSGKNIRYDKSDNCTECWSDLYEEGDFYRNELIANKAIKAGIRYALGFHPKKSAKIEKFTDYTKLSKKQWKYLFFLNRLTYPGIKLYKKLKPIYNNIKTFIQKTKFF